MNTGGIVRVLSVERLGPYAAAMGTVDDGLRLYEWNLSLSSGGGAAYETRLWAPALHRAFPHYRGPRRSVHQRLVTMRLFRNRIAHHEPIHYRHLAADHATMLTILGWVSPEFAAWVDSRSRVPTLLAIKPAT